MSALDGEDLAEFLHCDEFATDVTLASGAVIRGIFTDASVDEDHGEAMVELTVADIVEHNLIHDARVFIVRPSDGERTEFAIGGRQMDGTGMATVLLEKI